MQSSVVMFTFSVFIQKYLNMYNMKNSLVLFTFFHFDWTYIFWANLVKKVKVVSLGRNLVLRLTWICRIQWGCSLFFSSRPEMLFLSKLVQKNKLSFKLKLDTRVSPSSGGLGWSPWLPKRLDCPLHVPFSLPRSLVSRRMWILRIHWCCSPFLFLTGNSLLRQIWSKKSKLSV